CLHGPRDHQDLHSFPTRRSSDLKKLLPLSFVDGIANQPKNTGNLISADNQSAVRDLKVSTGQVFQTPFYTKEKDRQTDSASVLPDRKSTRLNSSHVKISYAVCCL